MADPEQAGKFSSDGMCRCRGCTAARKRVVTDLKNLFAEDESLLKKIDEYWESIK